MGEIVGLAYFAELPAVIFDVQRAGPSTGLPTRTAQGDITQVASLSHGDTRHVMLFPAGPQECFEMSQRAFDLADRLQAPIFVMSDLDLGMNLWPSVPFQADDAPADRGKILTEEDLAAGREFRRYADVDGDAIPYRTLPGNRDARSAFFTRGSGHNEEARYTECPKTYKRVLDRLRRKFDTARDLVPRPQVDRVVGAKIGLIAFGSTDLAMREVDHRLQAEGVETSYLRLRAYPFHDDVGDFVRDHDRVYVVEQNRDGQMRQLLLLDLAADLADRIGSIRIYWGLPIDAGSIVEALMAQERVEGKEVAHVG
jgi:2-oxoglutarate ferredoxin oxidoreductase subunit alpha